MAICGRTDAGNSRFSALRLIVRCHHNLNLAEPPPPPKKKVVDELKLVRDLQFGDAAVRTAAATGVRLLAREDSEARTSLALLGAIPPLVAMIIHPHSQSASLYALLNLAIANDDNKAVIVKAGALHHMLMLIHSPTNSLTSSVSEAIVANLLSLSALDSNKWIIGPSGAIPFLVKSLLDLDSPQSKQDALRALYNLSILPSNIPFILETDLITFLIASLGDMEVSERSLSILTNVVSTSEGRKAIRAIPDAFVILIDVLSWNDSPGCQKKVSYTLMVMAYKSYGDRRAMLDAGIVSPLLELSLIGTTLAQKRACRMLECLRVDKGKQISDNFCGDLEATVSAPIHWSSSSFRNINDSLLECEDTMSEEKRSVKQLVHQSLQNNMRRILKRANLPQDYFVPSEHFKSLATCSIPKSLPF